jgi:hypothetical protein
MRHWPAALLIIALSATSASAGTQEKRSTAQTQSAVREAMVTVMSIFAYQYAPQAVVPPAPRTVAQPTATGTPVATK